MNTRRAVLLMAALILSSVPLVVMNQTAIAAQVTDRSLNISSAQAGKTGVTYTFSFHPSTSAIIDAMTFQACTTAIGACTAPSGINIQAGTVALGTTAPNVWTDTTAFTQDTTSNITGPPAINCATTSVLCIKRSAATAESTTVLHQLDVSGVTNQDSTNCSNAPNCTFFIRMQTYNANTYASAAQVDYGTVASSTTQKFTVNAIVEEQLSFCVGATSVDNATGVVPTCGTISGTSLSLGVLGNGYVSVSPVLSTDDGDANNGIAELETNSANGTAVSYDAVQQPGSNHQGALRVQGATCASSGTSLTDQCINSIGTTSATLTAGTESFGMAIAGVNCYNATTYYNCSFATGTFNLVPTANYNCNGIVAGSPDTYTSDFGQISGTTACKYAWDESGTSQTIASSTTAVGNEALILKFAATPNLITPTGTYTAQADYVATPAY